MFASMMNFKVVWRTFDKVAFSGRIRLMYPLYFILSSEINAYQKQIEVISITSEMI